MGGRDEETLLEFPCRFPIKIMGRDSEAFHRAALELVESYAGEIPEEDVSRSSSSKGNFVSITVTIEAVSQEQLDNIYQALTDHEEILVAL